MERAKSSNRQILIAETVKEKPPNLCQLKKIPGAACTMICAFEHGCPVMVVDEHDNPVLRRGDC